MDCGTKLLFSDFHSLAFSVNLLIFAASALVVWLAGTKVTHYADEIATRSGFGEALIGLFLLAGVTSLPEIATSFSAALSGNAPLAVNNLLGSISMQIAVLALGDFFYGRHALTSVVPDPVVMLQGSLNIVLLSLVAVAIIYGGESGDSEILGAGLWTWALLIGALYSMFKLKESNQRKPWIANTKEQEEDTQEASDKDYNSSAAVLGFKTAAMAAIILAAGFTVARSGEAIAEQSGLGASFMGVAFVAMATSLPEVSTVFASLRRGLNTMAISDILGTNILNIALLFGVDMIASGEPVLNRVGNFAAVAAAMGIALTGVFLVGLAERRDRTIFGMGIDSAFVLVFYSCSLALLFSLR